MKTYLLSLIATAAVAALVGFLSPEGNLGKYVKLVSMLLLLTVILAPLPTAIGSLRDLPALFRTGGEETGSEQESLQNVLDTTSKTYFAAELTERLEERFGVAPGEISPVIRWEERQGESIPAEVTLLLSGRAKWKDSAKMETYVRDLLGCPCHSAIDSG